MAKLSSAAWMAHDLGLAASLGGTLFGRVALQPALYKIAMLSGREVSGRARALVRTKDALVIASLVTGVASIALGTMLGKRGVEGRGPQAVSAGERFGHSEKTIARTRAIKRSVGLLGILNMLATASVGAVTTLLAMEGNKSARFAPFSRRLP